MQVQLKDNMPFPLFLGLSLLTVFTFSSCGDSSPSSLITTTVATPTPSAPTYTIGGTVSGLTGTVVLQNNTADDLTLTTNSSFAFATSLADSSTFSITVSTQPTGQVCTVSSGTGTIASANVTGVGVTCVTTPTDKKIFMTASGHNGNFGGVAGADTFCMGDANYPGTGTYKALLTNGSTRIACTTANCGTGPSEHVGWVLAANKRYTRTDGTEIGTTTANAIFSFPLTNSISTVSITSWTGFDTDWTALSGYNCTGWNSSSVGSNGGDGSSTATNIVSVSSYYNTCNSATRRLYCVEQ